MATEATPDHLSLEQGAALLGVSARTLASWAQRGEVPCHSAPDGVRRFDRTRLEEFARSLPTRPPARPRASQARGL